jgi:hypothetical protein
MAASRPSVHTFFPAQNGWFFFRRFFRCRRFFFLFFLATSSEGLKSETGSPARAEPARARARPRREGVAARERRRAVR